MSNQIRVRPFPWRDADARWAVGHESFRVAQKTRLPEDLTLEEFISDSKWIRVCRSYIIPAA
jgi:hypothetical protein